MHTQAAFQVHKNKTQLKIQCKITDLTTQIQRTVQQEPLFYLLANHSCWITINPIEVKVQRFLVVCRPLRSHYKWNAIDIIYSSGVWYGENSSHYWSLGVHWIYVSSGLRRAFLSSSLTFSLVSANHFIPLTYEIVSTGMMRQKLCNYIIPVHPMTQIAWFWCFLWNLQGTTGVFKASIWSLKDTSVRVPQLF